MPKYIIYMFRGERYADIIRNREHFSGAEYSGSIDPVPDPSLLLDIPFDGDFENKVVGGVQMVVAGGAPTFANGAAVFDGTQSIKTATALDIGTDKVTLIGWIKTTQTNFGIIGEYSTDSYTYGGFMVLSGNNFTVFDSENQQNNEKSIVLNLSSFKHVAVTIDRSAAPDYSIRLYENGVLKTLNNYSSADLNGIFSGKTFFIGQRNGSQLPFIGALKYYQLYNRVLSDAEILAKYNEVPQPPKYRYIRDYANGNSLNGYCTWTEIKAFENGVNVALNKPVSTTGTLSPYGGGLNLVTDGNTSNAVDGDYAVLEPTGQPQYMQVDLGALYDIDSIKVWHYHGDGRTFHNTKTQVSADGVSWVTVFDSAVSGEYPESAAGHEILL